MPVLSLFLLGPFQATLDDHPITGFDSNKVRALLAYLAVEADRPHARDELIGLLWPDQSDAAARANLRQALANLRQVIGDRTSEVPFLSTTSDSIQFNRIKHCTIDVVVFAEWIAACHAHVHRRLETCRSCAQRLQQAVELYRGDSLAQFVPGGSEAFEEWALIKRERLRRDVLDALYHLTQHFEWRGDYAQALQYAQRQLELDPWREEAHRQVMRILALTEQRSAALAQYETCRRVLAGELGAEPSEETTALYEQIKAGTVVPDLRQWSWPISATPLIGREAELAEVNAIWHKARTGEGQVLLISGEPGIGKTRLMHELMAQERYDNAIVLLGECYAEGSAPFAPIAQVIQAALGPSGAPQNQKGLAPSILADLITFVPTLRDRFPDVAPNLPLEPQAEQQRRFDSVASLLSTLATRAPVLLVIEDAHWADNATLALLRHLARRLRRSTAVIIATHRESSLDETRFFHEWLGDLQHECEATLINLTRLDKDRTRDLLAAIFREAITPEFLDDIFNATEGNPFFVTEICQALIDEGAVYRASEGWQRLSMAQIQIPKSVRLAIQRRVAQLSKAAQETLQRAAILGREFEFDVLQAMSDLDEEGLIDALETAERAQLIAEVTRPSRTARLSFTFVHALIPSTLDEELNTVRRQHLHHRAAAAIESLHPNDVEALAYHFAAAGEQDKAIGYSCLAAERAEALYAYDTAIQHLQIALDLIEAGEQNETRMAVLEKLADAHRLRGERAEAIQIYQQALEVWRRMTNADKWLAVRLHRKIGETFNHLATGADIERFRAMALSGLESALKLIEGEPPHPESARLLTTVANTAYWRSYGPADALPDQSEMEHYARAAVAMAEKLSAPVELSAALEALANIYSAQGLLRERMQIGLRRLALSRDPRFTDRREQVNMLCQVGTALCSVGDYVQALTYLLEAERLADEIRDSDDVIQALGMQVQCFFGLDRWEEILQVEDKRLALQAHYGSARIGRICRQCGVSAYVYGWRGEMELARSNREEVYNNHTKFWGPTESWPVIGHY